MTAKEHLEQAIELYGQKNAGALRAAHDHMVRNAVPPEKHPAAYRAMFGNTPKRPNVVELGKRLEVNRGDLELSLSVTRKLGNMTTEVIIEEKPCDSFVAGFIKMLYGQASGENVNQVSTDRYQNISFVDKDAVPTRITTPSSHSLVTGDTTRIGGVVGSTGVNGNSYWITVINSTQFDLYVDQARTIGEDISLGAAYVSGGSLYRFFDDVQFDRSPQHLDIADIFVGGGNTLVDIGDVGLEEIFYSGTDSNQFAYSAVTVNVPAVTTDQSQITISRDITNNSGASITVDEVGLFCEGAGVTKVMIARDLKNFVVGAGSTVTVNYVLQVTNTAAGGFLQQFFEILYRFFSQASRPAFDIDNVSRSNNPTDFDFCMCGPGGNNHLDKDNTPTSGVGFEVGPVAGTGTSVVSNNNVALEAQIVEGEAAGQLVHYGSVVRNLAVGASTASFDIVRVFFNNSGGAITVNEVALYCHGGSSQNIEYAYAIGRHQVSPGVTVNNGDYLRVTYTIQASE